MKITILFPCITDNGTLNPGDVVEIDESIAANWIENGLAVEVPEN